MLEHDLVVVPLFGGCRVIGPQLEVLLLHTRRVEPNTAILWHRGIQAFSQHAPLIVVWGLLLCKSGFSRWQIQFFILEDAELEQHSFKLC